MAVEMIEIVSTIELLIATISWILVVIFALTTSFGAIARSSNDEAKTYRRYNLFGLGNEMPPGVIIIIVLALVFALRFYTWLTLQLRAGVKNRNAEQVRTWFSLYFVFWIFESLTILALAIVNGHIGFGPVILVIYRAWALYVARAFMKKLSEEGVEGGGDPTVPLGEVKLEAQP